MKGPSADDVEKIAKKCGIDTSKIKTKKDRCDAIEAMKAKMSKSAGEKPKKESKKKSKKEEKPKKESTKKSKKKEESEEESEVVPKSGCKPYDTKTKCMKGPSVEDVEKIAKKCGIDTSKIKTKKDRCDAIEAMKAKMSKSRGEKPKKESKKKKEESESEESESEKDKRLYTLQEIQLRMSENPKMFKDLKEIEFEKFNMKKLQEFLKKVKARSDEESEEKKSEPESSESEESEVVEPKKEKCDLYKNITACRKATAPAVEKVAKGCGIDTKKVSKKDDRCAALEKLRKKMETVKEKPSKKESDKKKCHNMTLSEFKKLSESKSEKVLGEAGLKSKYLPEDKEERFEYLCALERPRCDPVKGKMCDDPLVCDVSKGMNLCVPEFKKHKLSKFEHKGKTIIGTKSAIDKLKEQLAEMESSSSSSSSEEEQPKCDPMKGNWCKEPLVCDVSGKYGVCVPSKDSKKDGYDKVEYKGKTIIGTKTAIKKLRDEIENMSEEKEAPPEDSDIEEMDDKQRTKVLVQLSKITGKNLQVYEDLSIDELLKKHKKKRNKQHALAVEISEKSGKDFRKYDTLSIKELKVLKNKLEHEEESRLGKYEEESIPEKELLETPIKKTEKKKPEPSSSEDSSIPMSEKKKKEEKKSGSSSSEESSAPLRKKKKKGEKESEPSSSEDSSESNVEDVESILSGVIEGDKKTEDLKKIQRSVLKCLGLLSD